MSHDLGDDFNPDDCCLHDLPASHPNAPGRVCCHCGHMATWGAGRDHGKFVPQDPGAEVADLKARLKAVRRMTAIDRRRNEYGDRWESLEAATDLRVKNWRKT